MVRERSEPGWGFWSRTGEQRGCAGNSTLVPFLLSTVYSVCLSLSLSLSLSLFLSLSLRISLIRRRPSLWQAAIRRRA